MTGQKKYVFIGNVTDEARQAARQRHGFGDEDVLNMTPGEFDPDAVTLAQNYEPGWLPEELTDPAIGSQRHHAREQAHYTRLKDVDTVYVDGQTYDQEAGLPEHLWVLGLAEGLLPNLKNGIWVVRQDDDGNPRFDDTQDWRPGMKG